MLSSYPFSPQHLHSLQLQTHAIQGLELQNTLYQNAHILNPSQAAASLSKAASPPLYLSINSQHYFPKLPEPSHVNSALVEVAQGLSHISIHCLTFQVVHATPLFSVKTVTSGPFSPGVFQATLSSKGKNQLPWASSPSLTFHSPLGSAPHPQCIPVSETASSSPSSTTDLFGSLGFFPCYIQKTKLLTIPS